MTFQNFNLTKRLNATSHPIARTLLTYMAGKQTNLCVSIDTACKQTLLDLANQLGPHICILKTHIDLLENFELELTDQLKKLAQKHQFLIFEDRKFADIGNTVQQQYAGGMYRIASWSDFINAHPIVGPGVIEGLKTQGAPLRRGLILMAEMSSKGHLMDPQYVQKVLQMADQYKDYVFGFISMGKISPHPYHLHLTPGVQLEKSAGSLGQQYRSVEEVIIEAKSDIIIVGQGITKAKDPITAAKNYQKAGFEALIRRDI